MKILFLDDMGSRAEVYLRSNVGHNIRWVKTAAEAMRFLQKEGPTYDLVTLDHDLDEAAYGGAPREKTGHDVARFIAGMPDGMRPKVVRVHSLNPVGAPAMVRTLQDAGIPARWVPFNGRPER